MIRIRRAFAFLLCLASLEFLAQAQTTAFTYQGKLTDAGNPANGNYDLQFKLFDAPAGGAQQGATQARSPVAASAGVFTVTLDFGANVFGGAARYLEIGVRPAGNASAYTVLAPRQPVTSAPYAIQTLNAQQLGGLPPIRFVQTDLNGNVGIGEPNPTAKLQVLNTAPGTSAIYGESATGRGVWGKSVSNRGVYGESTSLEGVLGVSSNGSGVAGFSSNGAGVYGESAAFSNSTSAAVYGKATGVGGTGVYGQALTAGGWGVFAESMNDSGVEARSNSGNGVNASSVSGSGVVGSTFVSSLTAAGVYGFNSAGGGIGVIGEANTNNAVGVFGTSTSPAGFAVYARNLGGYAGYFEGKVHVTGLLEKPGGGFKIDHPLDPENKYLIHSFVESPDMKNLYDGTVTTDANGEAEITLPDWFAALNRDFHYQLTCIGVFAQAIVAEEITGHRFKVRTSLPRVKVSWQVTGIRQDAWANQNRLPVEELKPAVERGSYQNPSAFGQPEEKSVEWARDPVRMKQRKEYQKNHQKEQVERWQRTRDNKDTAHTANPNN